MALLGHQGTGDTAHDMKQFYEGPRGRKHSMHMKQFYEGPRGRSHNTWQEALLRGTKGQDAL